MNVSWTHGDTTRDVARKFARSYDETDVKGKTDSVMCRVEHREPDDSYHREVFGNILVSIHPRDRDESDHFGTWYSERHNVELHANALNRLLRRVRKIVVSLERELRPDRGDLFICPYCGKPEREKNRVTYSVLLNRTVRTGFDRRGVYDSCASVSSLLPPRAESIFHKDEDLLLSIADLGWDETVTYTKSNGYYNTDVNDRKFKQVLHDARNHPENLDHTIEHDPETVRDVLEEVEV